MKKVAIVFGIILLAVGVLGFIPALTPEGRLLGVFAVDAMHNIVHVVTGLAAIGLGMAGDGPARNFFRVFGVVYALIAVMGFVAGGDGRVMGITMNMADHWLHVAIAAFALWCGFAGTRTPTRRDPGLSGA